MEQNRADWSEIAKNSEVQGTASQKRKVLFGWWIVSAVIFVIFLVVASSGGRFMDGVS